MESIEKCIVLCVYLDYEHWQQCCIFEIELYLKGEIRG